MNIKIKNNSLSFRDYKLKCAIGKSGITNNKKEGDLATPKGIFKLGLLYYREDRIKLPRCNIRRRKIKKSMGWCNDSRSKKYNNEIKFPFKFKAEKLFRKDKIYDLLINIEYNSNPIIKNKGSAIFLHLSNNIKKPTKGCIGIKKEYFLKILPLINSKTKILIN